MDPYTPQSATELRIYANHVRDLARNLDDREATPRMNEYADELDARAEAMENAKDWR